MEGVLAADSNSNTITSKHGVNFAPVLWQHPSLASVLDLGYFKEKTKQKNQRGAISGCYTA